jgi:hypothetical protein
MDSPLSLVLLTSIAVASIVQAVALTTLLARGRRLGARLDDLERSLRPHFERAGHLVDDVADLAEGAARHMPQLESVVDDTLRKFRRTTDLVEEVALRPLRPLVRALAVWRGIRHGLGVYRALGPGRR